MYYSGKNFFARWADMPLTQAQKNSIEHKARMFLVENDAARMPIEPEALAQRVGLSVRYAAIPGNTIGKLDRDKKIIVVDAWLEDDPSYARCVISHELGHWNLEENDAEETLAEAAMASDTKSEDKELAASLFARAMLMPRPYLEKAVEIYRSEKQWEQYDSLIDYISSLFRVTKRKAKLRLEECGFVL